MKKIENKSFDEERALYGCNGVHVLACSFDGPADGESAFKEGKDILADKCYFNLRYPFWHDTGVTIHDCEMTQNCRAALWYSKDITITDTKLHGIKALRECANISMTGCSVQSPEFGWSSRNVRIKDSNAVGEYFMLRAEKLNFHKVTLQGKYSFQYITDSVFENCEFDTKDAFWHAKNVLVRNCVVKGEYLAWYCENVTFENCVIIGTQPLCYCKNLKLIDCEMREADLAFEKSEVEATLRAPIISIKNPISGFIKVPSAEKIVNEDPTSTCDIRVDF